MKVRTLAVIPFDAAQAAWLIEQAAKVAVGFDAHLVAVYPFDPNVWTIGTGPVPVTLSSLLDAEERQAAKMRATFEAVLKRNGLHGEFRVDAGVQNAEATLMEAIRKADAIILGATAGCTPDDRIFIQQLVRVGGRPVLLVGKQTSLRVPAKRIVIELTDAYDTANAADAVTGLATSDAEITILSCSPQATGPICATAALDDLAGALKRAGFKVTIADPPTGIVGSPEELLIFGHKMRAELLATGALADSPGHELLVDAIRRDLLDRILMPVLLSP